MLLEHQALTPRTPRAVGSPLVPDPDRANTLVLFLGLESDKPTSGTRVLTDQSDCSKTSRSTVVVSYPVIIIYGCMEGVQIVA